jgi:hypothetical protein
MNRRQGKQAGLVGLAIVVMALCLVMISRVSREPEYQGKPLRAWLEDLDGGYGSTKYHAGQTAIRAMGTNSLPFLIRYLRYKDPLFSRQWIRLKAKLGLSRGRVNNAVFWHRRAATACGELGIHAVPAFPAMAEAMNDERSSDYVADALARLLPSSAAVLTNILATGNATARRRAADALIFAWSHPSIDEMSRTALRQASNDADPFVRQSAIRALRGLPQTEPASGSARD